MKPFIHPDFLLHSETGKRLYHEFASKLPIIDYHCHLSPEMIASDRQFDNLGQIWLEGDHYKWRGMRSNGIDEKFCTGDASDYKKFEKWAETVPYTIGNPLYHWTHLELVRYFNINEQLSPKTVKSIYDQASALLRTPAYSVRGLMQKMNVEAVCTTDDPIDTLEYHLKLKKEFDVKVLPTFRPDRVLKADDPAVLNAYLKQLGQMADVEINNFENLILALDKRHAFFHESGCKLSDHGLDRFFYASFMQLEIDAIFAKLLAGKNVSDDDIEKYRTAVLLELTRMNHKRQWTQQLHVGALRNNNTRKFNQLGADTGWDSIGNAQDSAKISHFLDALDTTDQLAKTILYNLNPADNAMMATMIGNFNDGSAPGKIQYGAAWWFLDQKSGMEDHLKTLSALGLTTRFVGMVTDSRSFMSYPRHEYFRRIVCEYFGSEVDKGHIPNDDSLLKPAIEGISYYNAKKYFNF